jgi:NAD(P) transhydrogenase subunit alpha
MIVAVPSELLPGERRVALVPDSIKRLGDSVEVVVQAGAGESAGYLDTAYEEAGARIEPDTQRLWESADCVVKVRAPAESSGGHETDLLREGTTLIATLSPYAALDAVRRLAERRVTSFSLDLMPRITRAQGMDVLSSQSTVAGYHCVLLAASALPRLFPLMTTAAGTLAPARVLVIGAGVAGLQAIATARRLGAVVEAFDIRAATKEQVESLGARFVEQESAEDAETAGGYAKEQTAEQQAAQRELLARHVAESDVVISTALVPGRRAPVLVSEEQIKRMRPGSVVVDLAAEQGGNCALTRAGEVVREHGVSIHGPTDVASAHPYHASQMYSRNAQSYLQHLLKDGAIALDLEDELTSGPLLTHEGKIVHEGVKAAAEA